jgi:hypothetical protein
MFDTHYYRRRHTEALAGRPKWAPAIGQATFTEYDGHQKRLTDYDTSED